MKRRQSEHANSDSTAVMRIKRQKPTIACAQPNGDANPAQRVLSPLERLPDELFDMILEQLCGADYEDWWYESSSPPQDEMSAHANDGGRLDLSVSGFRRTISPTQKRKPSTLT